MSTIQTHDGYEIDFDAALNLIIEITAQKAQEIARESFENNVKKHLEDIFKKITIKAKNCLTSTYAYIPGGDLLHAMKNELEKRGFFCEIEDYVNADGMQKITISWNKNIKNEEKIK